MSDDRGLLREISWRDLCPWLLLFRSFGLASSLSVLALGAAAAALTPLGWSLSQAAFLSPETIKSDPELARLAIEQSVKPWDSTDAWRRIGDDSMVWPRLDSSGGPLFVFRKFVQPLAAIFSLKPTTIGRSAYLFSGLLWTIVVWGLFGGAINRIGVVELGRDEKPGLNRAFRFAIRRWRAYLLAPVFPLVGVALLTIPCAILGLLMRIEAGALISSVVWIFVLIAGIPMAILLIGLGLGWPLMWGTVSAEDDGDEFAALQHAFSYTFQRPWHYLSYALLTILLGTAGSIVVSFFAHLVVDLGLWSVSWGSGADRMVLLSHSNAVISATSTPDHESISMLENWAQYGLRFWRGIVWTVVDGFQYGFFFISAAGIYLLLRRDADKMELDEVFDDATQLALPLTAIPTPLPSSGESTTESAGE